MAEPLDYQIVLNLQTALAAMTTAGGYHYTMPVGAVRLNADANVEDLRKDAGMRPFILFELGEQRWGRDQYQPNMRIAHILQVGIAWVQDSDSADDTSLLKTFFRGAADVEKAITADVTRGGLATDTTIAGVERTGEGAEVWAVVIAEIKTYRTFGRPNG